MNRRCACRFRHYSGRNYGLTGDAHQQQMTVYLEIKLFAYSENAFINKQERKRIEHKLYFLRKKQNGAQKRSWNLFCSAVSLVIQVLCTLFEPSGSDLRLFEDISVDQICRKENAFQIELNLLQEAIPCHS